MTKASSEAPASRVARHRGAYRVQTLLTWFATLSVAVAALYVVFFLWLVPVRVSGDSMQPTLQNGEIVLIDRAAKYWKTPDRGDIIAFTDPKTGGLLLKRVVATGGESIDLVDGCAYVDGCPLDESDYLQKTLASANASVVTVPPGAVYVLSDDRGYGGDSRDPSVGCIRYEQIRGVVRIRLLPAKRIALFF